LVITVRLLSLAGTTEQPRGGFRCLQRVAAGAIAVREDPEFDLFLLRVWICGRRGEGRA
jgi:hypothetical protein